MDKPPAIRHTGDLVHELRFPYDLGYYRERAEKARRRLSLTKRLAGSPLFKIPAGTFRG